MPLVDGAIYADGIRGAELESIAEASQILAGPSGIVWVGLYRPDAQELSELAATFSLHEEIMAELMVTHHRTKLKRVGNQLLSVLRPARYVDAIEEVEFGEIHVVLGENYLVTIRQAEAPDLGRVRHRLERNVERLAKGPEAVLFAIIDQVVEEYEPVMDGLENDIDEIEDQLFGDDASVSRRIFDLSREVIDFQRATHSLLHLVEHLEGGFVQYGTDHELQRRLHETKDHLTRAVDRADAFRQVLQNALSVQTTLVNQRQNEEMKILTEVSNGQNEEAKRIASWAAILFAPTLVGTVYGMNFTHMPELHWFYGYLFAVGLMGAISVVLYFVFKRRDWL